MALKERVQKRIDGMKVEGGWRMKLAVYGGAVLMVVGILLVMYLLLGGIGSTPQVGTVTVRSSSGEVTPPLQPNLHHHPGGPHGIPAAGARRGGGQRPHGGL